MKRIMKYIILLTLKWNDYKKIIYFIKYIKEPLNNFNEKNYLIKVLRPMKRIIKTWSIFKN